MKNIRVVTEFRVARFVIVGVANTAVNFTVLDFAFYVLHQGKIVSSFIATSCAIIFSFILNRNFVFVDKKRPAKKLVLFIVFTVSGVLLVQNSVFVLGVTILHHHELGVSSAIHALTRIRLSNDFIDINLSNFIASLFVMIWNYNCYRIFVFRSERSGRATTQEAISEKA